MGTTLYHNQGCVNVDTVEIPSEKQKQAYRIAREGSNLFLTGKAGSGKSFIKTCHSANFLKCKQILEK